VSGVWGGGLVVLGTAQEEVEVGRAGGGRSKYINIAR